MKILIISDTFYPYGVAMSSRLRAFCLLFQSVGYNVHVITLYSKDPTACVGKIYEINGSTYEIASPTPPTSKDSFKGNPYFIPCIYKYLKNNSVDIILSTACQCYFEKINRLVSKYYLPYIIEQCEWYDISSYKLGKLDPRYLRFSRLFNKTYKKANGVIAISRLLDQHFNNMEMNTVRIPALLDVQNTPSTTSTNNDKIQIVYTGISWGAKELISPIIECFSYTDYICNKFILNIYGPSREQIIKEMKNPKSLPENVIFHGLVPQEKISDMLTSADYQIILRPNRRSSHAGFPTKLGESMAAGTPVITNDTGDICLYLKDHINGFVLKDNSTSAVKEVLEKIMSLTSEEVKSMRSHARQTAEESFDYRNYSSIINDFLHNQI